MKSVRSPPSSDFSTKSSCRWRMKNEKRRAQKWYITGAYGMKGASLPFVGFDEAEVSNTLFFHTEKIAIAGNWQGNWAHKCIHNVPFWFSVARFFRALQRDDSTVIGIVLRYSRRLFDLNSTLNWRRRHGIRGTESSLSFSPSFPLLHSASFIRLTLLAAPCARSTYWLASRCKENTWHNS